MTEKPSNIYTALASAQLEFGTVRKGATNPAFRSKYADLSDVATVVIPTLAEKGVCVLHYITGEGLDVMRTEFVHGESGTKIFCDVRLIVSKNDMQGMKSATTYAKRIGLESLSGIAPEDDDGNAAVVAAPKQQPRQQPVQRQEGPDPVEMAVKALSGAETLEALSSIWASVRQVQRDPRVIAAKDGRKAELSEGAGNE